MIPIPLTATAFMAIQSQESPFGESIFSDCIFCEADSGLPRTCRNRLARVAAGLFNKSFVQGSHFDAD
jgi:hypothetical protein